MRQAAQNASEFEQSVAATIHRWNMLPSGTAVGVAVSGGADSVCLLRVLAALQPAHGWTMRVLHVNHGLRGAESDADEAFVRELALQMRLPVEVRRVPAGEVPATGVEEWARQQRQSFFQGIRSSGVAARVATGHHRGDQAETVLFRLLRGAGSRGLGGMQPVTQEGIVRPLLEQNRDAIRQYLASLQQDWREDATNRDHQFARNSLRLQWIPKLTETWNPRLEEVLVATAEQLRDESAFLEQHASRTMKAMFRRGPHGWEARVADLRELPVALQRRVILLVAEAAGGSAVEGRRACRTTSPGLPGFAAVEAVRALWTNDTGHGRFRTRDLVCERSGAWVRAVESHAIETDRAKRKSARQDELRILEGVPGRYPAGDSAASVEVTYLAGSKTDSDGVGDRDSGYTGAWSLLETNRLRFPLTLRTWREGDAIQRVGCGSKRKIKHLFQRYGVPVWRRRDEWILESDGEIVWTSSFGAAATVLPDREDAGCLAIRDCSSDKEWESG